MVNDFRAIHNLLFSIHCSVVSLFSLFLFLHWSSAFAANLSINIGKDSTSVAAGRDFNFGYALIGVSATFTTDAPWSYVATEEGLDGACSDFQAGTTRDCEPKGRFQDGDEWEVFGKLGYRLPLIPIFYISGGLGVSRQKIANLYLFCDEINLIGDETKSCSKAGEFLTWGRTEEHYYTNFLAGVTVEMTRRLLLNLDYHTRKGLLGGLMWRF